MLVIALAAAVLWLLSHLPFLIARPMAHTELDVAYVARLARLRLTDEETQLFQEQLGHVLEHVAKLREVDVSGVEAAAHAIPDLQCFP